LFFRADLMVTGSWHFFANFTFVLLLITHFIHRLFVWLNVDNYQIFQEVETPVSLLGFLWQCLPFLAISTLIYGCYEKILKERFVINHSNENTRKFLLNVLDKQSLSSVIINGKGDV